AVRVAVVLGAAGREQVQPTEQRNGARRKARDQLRLKLSKLTAGDDTDGNDGEKVGKKCRHARVEARFRGGESVVKVECDEVDTVDGKGIDGARHGPIVMGRAGRFSSTGPTAQPATRVERTVARRGVRT